jgi:signal transduction histidine kinase
MLFGTTLPLAALIAYLALGANLLGTGLLLLINPRSRSVRWHAAFSFWLMAWLALQGWFALAPISPVGARVFGWVVHLMPVFFFAATLVETHEARDRTGIAIVLFGVLTAHWLQPLRAGSSALVWHSFLWGSAAILRLVARRPRGRRPAEPRPGERALVTILAVIVPVAVIAGIATRGAFLIYVLPLVTVLIQFLVFIGVVHHRFYDIEVRAARSGELATQAAEQERLALLGELSATLAHEIRNPLTGMRSLAQRLGEPDIDAGRRARYAAVILGEIGRLDRIVGNLLDLAKRSAVRADPVATTPLAPLFDDVLLLVDARARRAHVTLQRDDAGLAVAAARDPLAQVLLNLLLNAIAHSPPGGRVTLSASPHGDERVEIRVRDMGGGVPAEERERVFEPFHSRGLGAGLGLAVVRRIAHELDWQIGVADAAGGGAAFYVRVPASAARAAASAPSAADTAASAEAASPAGSG